MSAARRSKPGQVRVLTMGYEAETVPSFLEALRQNGVELLVDVRAAARSRRPGFAKTALAGNLEQAGIEYLHLKGLGTPAEGRAAARAGDHARMRAIFHDHLRSDAAQTDLEALAGIVTSGRRICLLCLEALPEHCHRSLVADALAERTGATILHLPPSGTGDPDGPA